MSVNEATSVEARFDLSKAGNGGMPGHGLQTYTGVAIFDGEAWASLCRELDIASVGDSMVEALINLKQAVREALTVAQEQGLTAGKRVENDDLFEFLKDRKSVV